MKKVIAILFAIDIAMGSVIAFLGYHISTTEQALAEYLQEHERQSKAAVRALYEKVTQSYQ